MDVLSEKVLADRPFLFFLCLNSLIKGPCLLIFVCVYEAALFFVMIIEIVTRLWLIRPFDWLDTTSSRIRLVYVEECLSILILTKHQIVVC